MEPKILITKPSADYELIDSGSGEKLERFGKFVLSRPDPQALWDKTLSEEEWKKADMSFLVDGASKGWRKNSHEIPSEWQIHFDELTFNIKPTSFKHTGIFPEQESNWKWTKEKIKDQISKIKDKPVKILNLFGYTGGATIAALSTGAEAVHVDGSKATVNWAKENAQASGLDKRPVRWLIDDARKFVTREIKRENKYDGIVMDPPSFGRGAKGEVWNIEDDVAPLIEQCFKILTDEPVFFLINGYASGYSSRAYYNLLTPLVKKYGGNIEFGELTIEESKGGRLLPCGIFARWSK